MRLSTHIPKYSHLTPTSTHSTITFRFARHYPMGLSVEAVLAIITLILTIPLSLITAWGSYRRSRRPRNVLGKALELPIEARGKGNQVEKNNTANETQETTER